MAETLSKRKLENAATLLAGLLRCCVPHVGCTLALSIVQPRILRLIRSLANSGETLKPVEWTKLKAHPGQQIFLHALCKALLIDSMQAASTSHAGVQGKRVRAGGQSGILATSVAQLVGRVDLAPVREGLAAFVRKKMKDSETREALMAVLAV